MTMTNNDQPNDRTREDELVTWALDKLPELRSFADPPKMTAVLGAYDADEGEGERIGLVEMERSGWAAYVRDLINWAEDAGFHVSVDSELHTESLPGEGRAVLNLGVRKANAPLFMNVFCEVDGHVDLEIYAQPLGRLDAESIWSGDLAALDVEAIREEAEARRPFVTGRTVELIEEAGVNPSQARVVALREVGLTHKEVAEYLDHTKGASASAQSRFNDSVAEAEHLFIARTGEPKCVLAKSHNDITTLEHAAFYVCEVVSSDFTNPISFITVMSNDDPLDGARLTVETKAFASLGECIASIYTERTFEDREECEHLYDVFRRIDDDRLADSGHETLDDPRSRMVSKA